MHKPLEDWRVGDIALCPDGVERTIHMRNDTGCYWILSEEHAASFWKQTDMMEMQRPLQNPVFRVGDLVRGRNPYAQGKWRWSQMDVDLTNPDRFALVERAPAKKPVVEAQRAGKWILEGVDWFRYNKATGVVVASAILDDPNPLWVACDHEDVSSAWSGPEGAKIWCDKRLEGAGWVLDGGPLTPPVRVSVLCCQLCKHPQPHGEEKHYASCYKNPELKLTRIRHLGWDQPPPITVLCQNDEDVP